jgi:hypothetical protein
VSPGRTVLRLLDQAVEISDIKVDASREPNGGDFAGPDQPTDRPDGEAQEFGSLGQREEASDGRRRRVGPRIRSGCVGLGHGYRGGRSAVRGFEVRELA